MVKGGIAFVAQFPDPFALVMQSTRMGENRQGFIKMPFQLTRE